MNTPPISEEEYAYIFSLPFAKSTLDRGGELWSDRGVDPYKKSIPLNRWEEYPKLLTKDTAIELFRDISDAHKMIPAAGNFLIEFMSEGCHPQTRLSLAEGREILQNKQARKLLFNIWAADYSNTNYMIIIGYVRFQDLLPHNEAVKIFHLENNWGQFFQEGSKLFEENSDPANKENRFLTQADIAEVFRDYTPPPPKLSRYKTSLKNTP
ncbi:MAG: hypothetical protein ACOYK8_08665 [Alphaproteobacteria bacterium]